MSNVMTPEFRGSYPNVFKPRKNELNGKDEYSMTALFAKGADLSKLYAACQAAIEKKWGKDKSKWPQNMRNPFRDQGERAKEGENGKKILPPGHEEGAKFLTLRSSQRPGVVDQNVQPIIDETQVYSGAWYRATISPYAYDQKGNRGVAFGLVNIQKVRDGEPLGGRTRAEDDFAPIEGAASDASATDASKLFS